MALPVILIDSATGSDSAASGAGPATALTGTAAATDGVNGKTVTITDAVDLSGVATDGSAALYLVDATAGHRNFDNITAISGTSGNWTVTVQNGFTISLAGKSWAIGGKRASIGGTNSLKLIDNNAAAGDAMPGWVIELQSAHSETIAATVTCRRSGDTTNGRIIFRGKSGAATRPLLTFSNNGIAFTWAIAYWTFQDFEVQNSNGTKTASIAFSLGTGTGYLTIRNVKVSHSTNKFWQFLSAFANSSYWTIEDNEVGYCASSGIVMTGGSSNGITIQNNWIHDCGSHGFDYQAVTGNWAGLRILGNVIAFNTGDGLHLMGTSTSATTLPGPLVRGNVIHGNGGDGIEWGQTSTQLAFLSAQCVENNRLTYNGGYGINWSGSGITDIILNTLGVIVRNNNFASNTSGKYNPSTLTVSQNETTTDPSGGLASATKDYAGTTSGSNFMSNADKALGYPIGGTLAVGTGSISYNYQDMGLQHQDTGGGATDQGGGMQGLGMSNDWNVTLWR